MADQLTTIGRSTVQHGKDNDRVYLIKLADEDMPELLGQIEALAAENGYGKIFAKVPVRWMTAFAEAGYTSEALVPFFFGGREDCHFMARYYDQDRTRQADREEITEVISRARRGDTAPQPSPATAYEIRRCRPEDSPEMAGLFREVFESYPFPIHDPGYIERTMAGDVVYSGAWDRSGHLAALSSAELDRLEKNVEMTDFVTAPSHRRRGLARQLLAVMEEEMRKSGVAVAYTIARAKSLGINKTFANAGYIYGGILINNTQICGRLESMNVWHKLLNDPARAVPLAPAPA